MPEDADDKDIKAAYKQAALAYHPDHIPEGVSKSMREDAAQTWVEIQEAFAVLSDPEKRAGYDTLLEEMRQSEEAKEQTRQPQSRAESIFAWFCRYWHYLCWVFATVVALFVAAIFAGFIRVSAPTPTTAAITSRSASASPSNPTSTLSTSALQDILKKHGFEEMPSACEKIPLNELDSCLINVKADFKKKTQEHTQGTHKPVTREKVTTLAKGFIVQPLEPSKDAQSSIGPNSIQGWIGVTTKYFGSGGAVVTEVAAGSPAARAGLKPGDVINAVNGISLRDEHLEEKMAAYKPGSTVRLGYMRGSWAMEAVVTVATTAP